MARDRVDHKGGHSALNFAFASLVTHSLFMTNTSELWLNETSSSLDRSLLYGNNADEGQADPIGCPSHPLQPEPQLYFRTTSGSNGKFSDDDFARIIQDATEDPAGQYRACGTAAIFKPITMRLFSTTSPPKSAPTPLPLLPRSQPLAVGLEATTYRCRRSTSIPSSTYTTSRYLQPPSSPRDVVRYLTSERRALTRGVSKYKRRPDLADVPEEGIPSVELMEALVKAYLTDAYKQKLSADPDDAKQRRFLGWTIHDHPRKEKTQRQDRLEKEFVERQELEDCLIFPIPPDANLIDHDKLQRKIIGSPPVWGLVSNITQSQYIHARSRDVWNDKDQSTFTTDLPIRRMVHPVILWGIESIKGRKGYRVIIVDGTKDAFTLSFEKKGKVYQLLAEYRDNLSPKKHTNTEEESIRASFDILRDSLDVRTTYDEKSGKTQWALKWRFPTHDPEGERLWIACVGALQVKTDVGNANMTPAPLVWCAICHGNDHTDPFCPFPKLSNWQEPPKEESTRKSGGFGSNTVQRFKAFQQGRGRSSLSHIHTYLSSRTLYPRIELHLPMPLPHIPK
ncbi:hypothetical protein D9611_011306 [Ephemerocybe angulata]|uniref:Uncharacterized protein n=1 Tax=Ephemerocybe angulata TaxID=980116 RepID=A0A8H5F1F0_9AGAR|nr:hypothetical protein D9611_011306 [Tulosesus angulatus]